MTETESPASPPEADASVASTPEGPSRLERLAPYLAGLALALPTLVAYYPPMSDLPLHESVVGIMHYWNNPEFVPPIYQLNLGHPNQLFHCLAWLFSLATGVRWGVKLVIALTQFAIFAAGARLADHLGRSRWGTLLLAPLALGFTYYWGLVANLLGFVALLAAIPVLDRGAESARGKDALRSIGVLALAFLAHESSLVILGALAAGLAFAHPLDAKKTPMRLVPTVAGVLMVVAQLAYQKSLYTKAQPVLPMSFFPLGVKVSMFPNVLFGSHDEAARLALLLLAAVAMGGMVMGRVRAERAEGPEASAPTSGLARAQAFLFRYRWELAGLALLVGYFVLPFNWGGATLLHERFLGPAWALFAVTAAPLRARETPRVAVLVACTLPFAVLLTAWPQFADANKTQKDLAGLLEEIPPGSAATLCSLDRPLLRTRVYSAATGGARTAAVRGGRSGYSLMVSPISPVQVRPAVRWEEYDTRVYSAKTLSMRPKHDLRLFKYVVGHSREAIMRLAMVEAFKPEATLVRAEGEWLLFRSNLETIPVTATEPPVPPGLGGDTVLRRSLRIARAMVAAAKGEPPPKEETPEDEPAGPPKDEAP